MELISNIPDQTRSQRVGNAISGNLANILILQTPVFMQVSEFTNQQACCGDIREQGMAITGNRGDATDLMLQNDAPCAMRRRIG